MQKLFLLLTILASVMVSCQSPQQKIAKLWLFTHYSGLSNTKEIGLSPASFLLLEPHGSFTKNFPAFQSGRWKLNNDELSLFNGTNKLASYKVSADGHNMRLTTEEKGLANFESSPLNIEKRDENPFNIENNKWLIKAPHKETDSEIRERLLNHLAYWESYFTWALNNNLQSIDVRSAPTPIKIYSNGFTIKPLTDLPRTWINLFFDEQDCVRANEILQEEVKKASIAWPQTESKYKSFISAFQQLQNSMNSPV